MTLIITDKPLEDHLEHIPPKKSPVEDVILNIRGEEIHTRSDLWEPHNYREYLVHGPLTIQRRVRTLKSGPDPTPPKVDRLLMESGNDWFSYFTRDYCSRSTMEQILFVYWYLANIGDRIILYRQQGLESLSPETPVARIDVSDKPLSDTILMNIQNDVLYLFIDSKGNSHLHDTRILERMGKDPRHSRFSTFHAPEDGLTLSGLREALGNCYSLISVYDLLDVQTAADNLRFKEWREAYEHSARPIEIISRTQDFADTCFEQG